MGKHRSRRYELALSVGAKVESVIKDFVQRGIVELEYAQTVVRRNRKLESTTLSLPRDRSKLIAYLKWLAYHVNLYVRLDQASQHKAEKAEDAETAEDDDDLQDKTATREQLLAQWFSIISRILRMSTRDFPTDERLVLTGADILMRAGACRNLDGWLQKRLYANPRSKRVWLLLADCQWHAGNRTGAVRVLQRALHFFPEDAAIMESLGNALKFIAFLNEAHGRKMELEQDSETEQAAKVRGHFAFGIESGDASEELSE